MVAIHVALNSLVLIHGGESALADRALSQVLSERSNYERTIIDGGELEIGRYGEAIAPSLFSEKRVIVLRDLQDVSAEVGEEIVENFANIDPFTHIVFLHKGGVKGKGLVDKIKKLKAEYIECEPLKKQSDKESFVREEFNRHARKISSGAVTALVNAIGSDTRELAAACSQISSDTNAGKAVIDESDIANYYQGRIEATGFDVADAALAGDVTSTLISLRNALDSGTDPVMIISAVANSVRSLAKVSDLPRNVRSFDAAGKLGMAPWQIDKARRQLSNWRPGMITFAISELARADIEIKGGSADPIYALERAMVAIAKNVSSGRSV